MQSMQQSHDDWLSASVAPSDADLEVCVIDRQGVHTLAFPARWSGYGWRSAHSQRRLDIDPTHWRPWSAEQAGQAAIR